MISDQLPQALVLLVENPTRLSGQRLWTALDDDDKSAALQSYVDKENGRSKLVAHIATVRNFRAKTVAGWGDGKIVDAMKQLSISNQLATILLVELNLGRAGMCQRFLDSFDISNDKGRITSPFFGYELEVAAVHEAADNLVREFGLLKVVVYFLTLAIQQQPFSDHLWQWLKGLPARANEITPAKPESVEPDKADPYETAEGDVVVSPHHLTTLDHLVKKSVEDSKSGIVGSLLEDEIHDVVDEFLSLNAERPQTFFHAGFRDAVFDRQLEKGVSPGSSRWYWAGAVRGWASRENWSRIVAEFDRNPIVRALGDGADSASDEVSWYITRALKQEKRPGEVSDFVKSRALRRPGGQLFQEMLEIGTELLHREEPGEARAVFDRLMEAVKALIDDGYPPAHARFLTVRRRRAHCLRMLLEHDQARLILRELLDLDPDSNNQAMVRADLGMLAGNFNRLKDVSLPNRQEEVPDFLDRLKEGREEFLLSVKNDVPYASHGHYCLGVLALGAEKYNEAENHLERARGHFKSRLKSYGNDLVARTDLYLGISRAAGVMSAGDLTHAARVMIDALESGTPFPPYLINPAVEGLEVGASSDVFSRFIDTVLKFGSESALEVLWNNESAIALGPVTDALRDRAGKLEGSEEAASYLRACVKGYMSANRFDEAGDLLDKLETLATDGVGTAEFLDLLRFPERLQPAWDQEEVVVASARCLEARGDLVNALEALRPLFHRYAAKGEIQEADGILECIRCYGLPEDRYIQETRRLEALIEHGRESASQVNDPDKKNPARPLKILFVGGNEIQRKLESAVKDNLRERAPHVEVTFIFSGWDSNWRPHLEKVQAILHEHDALVLMRFMRTNLGREIRRLCGKKQWRSCWSSGHKGMADAILAAAESAETYA